MLIPIENKIAELVGLVDELVIGDFERICICRYNILSWNLIPFMNIWS